MQRSEVLKQVKQYIVTEVLDGKDIGLEETTPLLEWGIINSLEIVRLLSFVQERFAIEIPVEKMTADYFTSLNAITDLILESANAYSGKQ